MLLGSIATPKYVEPLLGVFGERLLFPSEFAGRGDMSRGGLMLRCARENVPLTYVPVATAERHGPQASQTAEASSQPRRDRRFFLRRRFENRLISAFGWLSRNLFLTITLDIRHRLYMMPLEN